MHSRQEEEWVEGGGGSIFFDDVMNDFICGLFGEGWRWQYILFFNDVMNDYEHQVFPCNIMIMAAADVFIFLLIYGNLVCILVICVIQGVVKLATCVETF